MKSSTSIYWIENLLMVKYADTPDPRSATMAKLLPVGVGRLGCANATCFFICHRFFLSFFDGQFRRTIIAA
jgi:hypothetical protein